MTRLPSYMFSFLILMGASACTSPKSDLGKAQKYLPGMRHLTEGIANKYYLHYKSKDGYDSSTSIEYEEYILAQPGELAVHLYDPAFELLNTTVYQFSDHQMLTKTHSKFFRGDTLSSEIIAPVFIDWNDSPPPSTQKTRFTFNKNTERTTVIERKFKKDTTVLNKPAKIFSHTITRKDTTDQIETDSFSGKYETIYAEGIGLYASKGEFAEGFIHLELIEQISQKEFQALKNHNVKRVGYIDPKKRLDKANDFSTCHQIESIVDYYNDGKSSRYPGGKKALWKIILPQIDKKLLHGESGYLNFRFVINCNGESGRFITEESSLDFAKKKFNQETVDHLYNIVKNLKGWQPPFIREKYHDTYNYLTFKLKDGEIIELLP